MLGKPVSTNPPYTKKETHGPMKPICPWTFFTLLSLHLKHYPSKTDLEGGPSQGVALVAGPVGGAAVAPSLVGPASGRVAQEGLVGHVVLDGQGGLAGAPGLPLVEALEVAGNTEKTCMSETRHFHGSSLSTLHETHTQNETPIKL